LRRKPALKAFAKTFVDRLPAGSGAYSWSPETPLVGTVPAERVSAASAVKRLKPPRTHQPAPVVSDLADTQLWGVASHVTVAGHLVLWKAP
jgi:hypothetical protein